MRYKPQHTCFRGECAGCAFELGEQLAKKKPKQTATYLWAVTGSENPCDIRRYAFSHKEAIAQLAHTKSFKDGRGGEWVLYKLTRVDRRKQTPSKEDLTTNK